MQEALFYSKLGNNKVRCELCPWFCQLNSGQTGICKVRTNEKGKLITLVYNKVAALGTDPIEKKPLYHFHPGKNILSLGEVGCNLHCSFCQNHRVSQCFADEFKGFHNITSEKIVSEALKTWNNIGVAYTYNEPLTFYEFLLDTAKFAKQAGLKNVVVSNGYINEGPLNRLLHFIDAFNIDLKAFSNEFYKKQTSGKLGPVLQSLKIIAKSKIHLEITNLVIPDLNDDEKQFGTMVEWIALELGNYTPLHLSRYFPQHKLQQAPTSIKKLEVLYNIAKQHLEHVYLGNVIDEKRSATYCSHCKKLLIERKRYKTGLNGIDENGRCKYCRANNNILL
ncbi:MAG: AmmeMemoRadiSam system radical SAM enzyme [Draconibacterium sp.]|nr:AmmeMemoRadiSam system radical SAM enzyme [Draconibacterium sp.]